MRLAGLWRMGTFPGGLRTVVQTLPEGLRSRGAGLQRWFPGRVTPLIITPVYAAFG